MEDKARRDDLGLFEALIGDGRPLLSLTGVSLVGSGLFAFFLAATGHFLPHDIAFLGMTPEQLHGVAEGRLVHFMIHDRVAFGGSILAVGTLYLWLAAFPLKEAKGWAWWTVAISGMLGFGSFLLYLGYGYLDTWHGVATLVLIPCFLLGLARSFVALNVPLQPGLLRRPGETTRWRSPSGIGRALLLITAACLMLGGLIIMGVGITSVFVPQDLDYMGVTAADLHRINPRLIPLIAHDRAGFGGGVCCCGFTMFFCVWCGRPSRSLWQAVLITGTSGFGSAIGIHPVIGYTDFSHLAPAYLGALLFAAGLALTYRPMVRGVGRRESTPRFSDAPSNT